MQYTREQLKGLLLQEVEADIERFLDWHAGTPAPTLRELEEELVALRREMSRQMAEIVLEGQEARQPVRPMACPRCQAGAQYKGLKEVVIESRVGPVEIERGYYYCPQCQEGFFPPRPAA